MFFSVRRNAPEGDSLMKFFTKVSSNVSTPATDLNDKAPATLEDLGYLIKPLTSPDWVDRLHAVNALAEFKNFTEVTYILSAKVKDSHLMVRIAAINALYDREGENVSRSLIESLDDPEWMVRNAAVISLSNHKGDKEKTALIPLAADNHWEVRKSAVEALQGFTGYEVIWTLEVSILDSVEEVRIASVSVLSTMDAPEVLPLLRETVLSDPSPRVRMHAVAKLEGIDSDEVDVILIQACHDGDPTVQEIACKTLHKRVPPKPIMVDKICPINR